MAKSSSIPPERLASYERVVATQPGLPRKGATVPYTSVNGNMFSFLTPEGTLALRLPAPEREEFLERFHTSLHEAHGTVMKEYVTVPGQLFEATEQLLPYFAASYAYASSLKPKPTRRAR
ncbi:MAG: TfoX/Sxy family protein [Chloroflexi bacterium]|nr:MAG: TfoX/Sxy family protein [Chloroflexota bacterium]